MTSLPPPVALHGRYSINECCALLGIHRNTLQRYTTKGLIKCDVRKGTFRKTYSGLEIMRFWNQKF